MTQLQDDPQTFDESNDAQPGFSNENDKNAGASVDDKNEDPDALVFGDSHLQTKEEFDLDKKGDHSQEDRIISAGGSVDDLASNSDGAAGTDRAGTAERKVYGDTELNKGLESQAMDEEGSNL